MYNGIGLQTARGSGTNGYVQTNKFLLVRRGKGFEGTAGLSKRPNKDILVEHDCKRQIHLKLAVLEDELSSDQGFSDEEIAQKLEEARLKFEDEESDEKISSDTSQTHQVAARKEKQMEAFRAALGLRDQEQAEEGIVDDDEPTEIDTDRDMKRLRRDMMKSTNVAGTDR